MDEELKELLLGMIDDEKRARAEVIATGEHFERYAPRLAEVHRRNAAKLESIIDEHGWPGCSLVGQAGAQAAWLVAQHADCAPQLQRRCLALLKDAAERGEAEPAYVAYLEDSICFHEGRPQRYGTQFEWDEHGRLAPWQLEDPDRVDAWRESVGLEPLGQRLERLRRTEHGGAQRASRTRRGAAAARQPAVGAAVKSVGWS